MTATRGTMNESLKRAMARFTRRNSVLRALPQVNSGVVDVLLRRCGVIGFPDPLR
jgi:hypothetical protein